jgi:hypothetical protein
MTTLPLTFILFGSVTLGCILVVNYLRGTHKPVLIGAHLICGVLALEQMALLFQGTPTGETVSAGYYGRTALGLFSLAMIFGFGAPLLRNSRTASNTVLIGHVSLATAGVLLYLAWVTHLS